MIPNTATINALYDNRSDPDTREVLRDLDLTTTDKESTRLGVALYIADAADAAITNLLTGAIDMTNGLKIIQVPGRWGYSVARVGWLRRVSGDEYVLLPGARTIMRTGTPRTIDSLASDGPGNDHILTAPSKATEEVHRLVIRRSVRADEQTWAAHCPRPEDWVEPA